MPGDRGNGEVTFAELVDWVEGRLSPERAEIVAARSEVDERTRARVEWLRGFVAVGAQFPLEQPPLRVREHLRAHFAVWRETQQSLREEIQQFPATVLFDSRERATFAGTRGAATDEVLHLAYTTRAADLVLDVQRLPGDRVAIDGQALFAEQNDTNDVVAAVLERGRLQQSVDGDRLGRFRIESAPDTVDELRVTAGAIVLVADLALRPDAS